MNRNNMINKTYTLVFKDANHTYMSKEERAKRINHVLTWRKMGTACCEPPVSLSSVPPEDRHYKNGELRLTLRGGNIRIDRQIKISWEILGYLDVDRDFNTEKRINS